MFEPQSAHAVYRSSELFVSDPTAPLSMTFAFNIENVQSLPPSALRHFCGADANIYLHEVASILFYNFQLSIKGERCISASLSNLPCIDTADDRLSFGWGSDNIIREAVIHQDGCEFLTFMVALVSVFHETYAAEVCHAYAAAVAGEADLLPRLRQWRRALRTACGVLIASEFLQLVADYIRLDPYKVALGSTLIAKRRRFSPTQMATGLMKLSNVTRNQQKQATLVGGAVIGWFAPFAEFSFDLKVALLSRTDEKLHGNPHDRATQLVLVNHEDPDLQVYTQYRSTFQGKGVDDDPFWTKHVHFPLSAAGSTGSHFSPKCSDVHSGFSRGRKARPWQNSSAAVLEALKATTNTIKLLAEIPCTTRRPTQSAYGLGLIRNLTAWLPELRRDQGRMERQLRRSPEDATHHYEEMILKLKTRCNCIVCSTTGSNLPPHDGYCLPVIYESGWEASTSQRLQNAVALFSGTRPEYDLNDSLVAIAHEGVCAFMIELLRSDTAPSRVADRGFIQITSGAINLRHKVFKWVGTQVHALVYVVVLWIGGCIDE